MNRKLSRMFECIGGSGWWIIILFFLFLVFQESHEHTIKSRIKNGIQSLKQISIKHS